MRERVRHQQTNRPKMDAGTNPTGAAENSRRTVTGKTTAGKTETYMEYHKGMNNCLFLDYCRRHSEISVKGRSDGNPWGGGSSCLASGRDRTEDSQQAPCRFLYKVKYTR